MNGSPGPATRTCVFCGGTPLTKEHVFGQWSSRMWYGEEPSGSGVDRDQIPFKYVGAEYDADGRFVPVVSGRYQGRPAIRPPNMVVKVVCARCNGGWMSQLEADAKPLIERFYAERKVQLSRPEIRALTRWCQKTVAILDCWNPDHKCVTPSVYQALYDGQVPPGVWDIRLARVDEDLEFAFCHTPHVVKSVPQTAPEEQPPPDMEFPPTQVIGVQSMYCIGTLLFMVRYSPHAFRGDTSIDADYYQVLHPPQTLFGREARRTFKPGSMPIYSAEDWDIWTLWSVARQPGVVPYVGTDPDGATFVDDVVKVLGDDFVVTERGEGTGLDVAELMSGPVRWDETP